MGSDPGTKGMDRTLICRALRLKGRERSSFYSEKETIMTNRNPQDPKHVQGQKPNEDQRRKQQQQAENPDRNEQQQGGMDPNRDRQQGNPDPVRHMPDQSR